jgi:hypothetical protein
VLLLLIHRFGEVKINPRSSSIISKLLLSNAITAAITINPADMVSMGDECRNRVMLAAFIYRL